MRHFSPLQKPQLLAAVKECATGKHQPAWHNGLYWRVLCEGLTRRRDTHLSGPHQKGYRHWGPSLNGSWAGELFDIWEEA